MAKVTYERLALDLDFRTVDIFLNTSREEQFEVRKKKLQGSERKRDAHKVALILPGATSAAVKSRLTNIH